MWLEITVVARYHRNTRMQCLKIKVLSSTTVSTLIDYLDQVSHQRDPWLHRTILVVWRPGVGKVFLDPQKTWGEQEAKNGWVIHVYRPGSHKHARAA
jgi:hypothetical protein